MKKNLVLLALLGVQTLILMASDCGSLGSSRDTLGSRRRLSEISITSVHSVKSSARAEPEASASAAPFGGWMQEYPFSPDRYFGAAVDAIIASGMVQQVTDLEYDPIAQIYSPSRAFKARRAGIYRPISTQTQGVSPVVSLPGSADAASPIAVASVLVALQGRPAIVCAERGSMCLDRQRFYPRISSAVVRPEPVVSPVAVQAPSPVAQVGNGKSWWCS